ncbi:MAG: hypothetical protein ONB23_08950 [candidate division KSB1 bacterium]|nr:hypothetical protein [candidate division KSB1 bacterium]
MDIFAHGLWSYQLVGRRGRVWPAVLVGTAPDLFAFLPYTTERLVRGQLWQPATGLPDFPLYVFRLYDVSHSLVVAAVVIGLVYLLRKRIPLFLVAWPLHILFDIPTHSRAFFPTPFLWPFSNLRVNGVPWSTPWLMLLNYGVLALLFALQARRRPGSQRT